VTFAEAVDRKNTPEPENGKRGGDSLEQEEQEFR